MFLQVSDLSKKLLTVARANNIRATFFDLATLIALGHFAQSRCDFVVMETGLGGMLLKLQHLTISECVCVLWYLFRQVG